MRRPVDNSSAALPLAFDRAAGQADDPIAALAKGIEPVARVLEDFARRVVAAGRRVADLPACPAALLRRAADLFRAPVDRGVAAIWRLLFDSARATDAALA